MVDSLGLKPSERKLVWVQIPPWAHKTKNKEPGSLFFVLKFVYLVSSLRFLGWRFEHQTL